MPRPEWIDCILVVEPWYDGVAHGLWIAEQDPRSRASMLHGPATQNIISICNKVASSRHFPGVRPSYGPLARPGFAEERGQSFFVRAVVDWWQHLGLREIPLREYLEQIAGEKS